MGPAGSDLLSGTNGSTYEGHPIWNGTVPVSNRSRVNRVHPYWIRTMVKPIPNGFDHIRSRLNVALSEDANKCY